MDYANVFITVGSLFVPIFWYKKIKRFDNRSADAKQAFNQCVIVGQCLEALIAHKANCKRDEALKELPALLKMLVENMSLLKSEKEAAQALMFLQKLYDEILKSKDEFDARTRIEHLDVVSGIESIKQLLDGIYNVRQ